MAPIHGETLLSCIKDETVSFATTTWTELKGIMLSKVSQAQEDKMHGPTGP